MPEYDRECGSKRIFDVVQMLREAGWDITYVARHDEGHDRYARALRQNGILTYAGFEAITDEAIARSRFDIAILAFWHVAEPWLPRLRRLSPATRIIVDSIDLHFLRSARGVFTRASSPAAAPALPASVGEEFVREVNAYAAADGLLAVSPKEAGLIGDLIGNPDGVRCVPLCEELPRSPLPFRDRRGLLFVGNFWHQPNVEAATYLVGEILPKVNPRLLTEHPLWIVGNASEDKVAPLGRAPHVHVVGWVPSVLPYLSRARVMTVPLRHGAGTKGKLIQSLAVGTPVVSTAVGIEGLDVRDGREALVADDAAAFARGIETLLSDEPRWRRMADRGHAHVTARHSREVVRERLLAAIGHFLERPDRIVAVTAAPERPAPAYDQVRAATRAAIERHLPAGAAVAVISKGDEALTKLENRRGEHFPQLGDGRYAGSYPADGAAAVEALERLRSNGVEYLAIPRTSSWWLEHYKEFAAHLERIGPPVFQDETCTLHGLSPAAARRAAGHASPPESRPRPKRRFVLPRGVDDLRPKILEHSLKPAGGARPKVLVAGIYLCGQANNAADEIAVLRASRRVELDQRWVALGGPPPPRLSDVTVLAIPEKTSKFAILNRLAASVPLAEYDYLVSIDDDIVLPHGFLDAFIELQQTLGFALAQPARTSDSYLDHPIVEQQRGVAARQTQFVEIGPVFSMHRSVFDLLLPFDLTSSMGWGYENVWSYLLRERGLKMGIIDAVPVCHGLRKSVANYSWHQADAERTAYWARHPHLPLDECFRVLAITGTSEVAHA
jgi:glycosyltransferase involved in cell wall biosynthesis